MKNEILNQLEGAIEEATLLQEYAEHLEVASTSKDNNYKLLVLNDNLNMWVSIDASLKNKTNGLPIQIKDNLSKLSKYVEQVTLSKGVDMGDVYYKSLAEINRQISAGLMESVNNNLAQQEAYYLAKSGLELTQAYRSKDDTKFVQALDNNQKLWIMIKTLMEKGNSKLPQEVKNNLIKLADYISLNTIKLGQDLKNIDKKLLDSFVEINRHIAEGLIGHR